MLIKLLWNYRFGRQCVGMGVEESEEKGKTSQGDVFDPAFFVFSRCDRAETNYRRENIGFRIVIDSATSELVFPIQPCLDSDPTLFHRKSPGPGKSALDGTAPRSKHYLWVTCHLV